MGNVHQTDGAWWKWCRGTAGVRLAVCKTLSPWTVLTLAGRSSAVGILTSHRSAPTVETPCFEKRYLHRSWWTPVTDRNLTPGQRRPVNGGIPQVGRRWVNDKLGAHR